MFFDGVTGVADRTSTLQKHPRIRVLPLAASASTPPVLVRALPAITTPAITPPGTPTYKYLAAPTSIPSYFHFPTSCPSTNHAFFRRPTQHQLRHFVFTTPHQQPTSNPNPKSNSFKMTGAGKSGGKAGAVKNTQS